MIKKASSRDPGRRSHSAPPKFRKPILAHFMIRGIDEKAHTASVAECGDIFDLLSQAEKTFPDFQRRNPWIFGDSVRGHTFVLLDPENTSAKSERSGRF